MRNRLWIEEVEGDEELLSAAGLVFVFWRDGCGLAEHRYTMAVLNLVPYELLIDTIR